MRLGSWSKFCEGWGGREGQGKYCLLGGGEIEGIGGRQ